jgi:hypothetical protein
LLASSASRVELLHKCEGSKFDNDNVWGKRCIGLPFSESSVTRVLGNPLIGYRLGSDTSVSAKQMEMQVDARLLEIWKSRVPKSKIARSIILMIIFGDMGIYDCKQQIETSHMDGNNDINKIALCKTRDSYLPLK